jgi:hypothetical protein
MESLLTGKIENAISTFSAPFLLMVDEKRGCPCSLAGAGAAGRQPRLAQYSLGKKMVLSWK